MDTPPVGFAFPTPAEYSTYLVRAVADVAPLVNASHDDLSPPVMAHVATIVGVLESESGLPLGELVKLASSIQTLASSTDASTIALAVGELVQGTLDLVSTTLKTAGVAAEAASAIPILGAFVDVVAGYLRAIYDSQQKYIEAQEACQRKHSQIMQLSCHDGVKSATPTPTQVNGTPSDLFRPYAYVIQQQQGKIPKGAGGSVLPLSPASVYVVLCGDALPADLFGGGYAQFRTPPKQGKYGAVLATASIPFATRRRMWSCIRSICASVERPGIKYTPQPVGDAGRAMMIVLQELVRSALLKGQLRREHIEAASGVVTSAWKHSGYCPELVSGEIAAGMVPYGAASCAGGGATPFVDLADPFMSQLLGFQNALFAEFFRGGKWTVSPATPIVRIPAAMIALSPSSTKKLAMVAGMLDRSPVTPKTRAIVGASAATILGAAAALAAML